MGAAIMERDGPRFDRKICGQCKNWDCLTSCHQEAISRAGKPMEVKSVLDRIAKDIPFYINSGGGVTFSGGEPYNQFHFLMELLRGCHTLGIHTAIETSGLAATPSLIASEPMVDLFLFDLKVMDSQRHIEQTGVDNHLIIENLTWLAGHVPQKVVIRLALIPGFTDDWDNLESIGALMDKLGLKEINLEPFNPMGVEKYKSAGKEYKGPIRVDPPYITYVKAVHTFFLAHGLRCELI
jgi:pyruvate formate lyase activating enzyme